MTEHQKRYDHACGCELQNVLRLMKSDISVMMLSWQINIYDVPSLRMFAIISFKQRYHVNK